VREQVPVVDQLLEDLALADQPEPQSGADGDEPEGRVRAPCPEPQLLAGQRCHVVGDDDSRSRRLAQRSGEVDVPPAQEDPLLDD
jgi:hypothetical protein